MQLKTSRVIMPRRTTHIGAGALCGIAAGVFTAESLPKKYQGLHFVCVTIGGVFGGVAPDLLEPALSPHHRSLFHSLAVGGAATSGLMSDWQAKCHEMAADCTSRAQLAPLGSRQRSSEEMNAFLWRVIAGLLIGFLVGYMSHLALDGTTQKGLPLLLAGL
jgi:membrane-bound metal-dependent hydrolase YbcI (DUF457 family)